MLGRAQPWRLDGAPSPPEFPRRKKVGPSQRLTELLPQSQPSPSTPRPPKRTPNAGVRAGFPSRCEAQPGQEEKLGRKAKCFPHSPGDAPSGKTGHKPGRDLVEGRPQPPPQLPLHLGALLTAGARATITGSLHPEGQRSPNLRPPSLLPGKADSGAGSGPGALIPAGNPGRVELRVPRGHQVPLTDVTAQHPASERTLSGPRTWEDRARHVACQ